MVLPSCCPLHLLPVWCCPPAAPSTCRLSGIALQLLYPPAHWPPWSHLEPAMLPQCPKQPGIELTPQHDCGEDHGRSVRGCREAGGGGRLCPFSSTIKVTPAMGGPRQLQSCFIPSVEGWFSLLFNQVSSSQFLHFSGRESKDHVGRCTNEDLRYLVIIYIVSGFQ